MKSNINRNSRGFTLVEVMIALVILAIVVVTITNTQYFMSKHSVIIKERAFATQKVIQIMEELRIVVSAKGTQIAILDDYDDGDTYSAFLTTNKSVTTPVSPLSDNTEIGSGHKYLRKISVSKVEEDPLVRKVQVRIYKTSPSAYNTPSELLAETMSVLNVFSSKINTPKQVYDIYVSVIESIGDSSSSTRSVLDSVVSNLQTRCQWVEIRVHYITRFSYGRDLEYTPYLSDATQFIYRYQPSARYDANFIRGRINVNGTIQNNNSYSMCDTFNHAVRYPDEERLYNEAVLQAQASGEPRPEISLRMLFEIMNSFPQELQNTIYTHVHGESLPLPPMRNYSDAAKDPQEHPNIRIVTHPERLRYNSLLDTVRLRVYSYVMNPDAWAGQSVLSTATIFLPGIQIPDNHITVTKIVGNDTVDYQAVTFTPPVPSTYTVTYPFGGGTLITLFDSPLRHPANICSNEGLSAANRLYGLEYIPCPVENANDFSWDLTFSPANRPKNTARWIISFDPNTFSNGMCTIETRIGDDLTTGTVTNEPPNLSRTYVWIGTDPPVTEQFQFMGDCRHSPYADVKGDNRYNWYFREVPAATNYVGFNRSQNGFQGAYDRIDVDELRYCQIIRNGLLNTQAIWFESAGWAFSNRLGGDSVNILNNSAGTWYARSWLGELYPDDTYDFWRSSGNLPGGNFLWRSCTATDATAFGFNRGLTGSAGTTMSLVNGESSANRTFTWMYCYFRRFGWGILTELGRNVSSMFNVVLSTQTTGPRAFTIDHPYNTWTNAEFNTPPDWNDNEYRNMRTTLSIPQINGIQRIFYNSNSPYPPNLDGFQGGGPYYCDGVVRISDATRTCYLIDQGAKHWNISGYLLTAPLGVTESIMAFLTYSIRTFLDGGLYSANQDRIHQLPFVEITKPTETDTFRDVSQISIEWTTQWRRADGQQYTEEYPEAYTETTPIVHNLKYSPDDGMSWFNCSDNTAAEAGRMDLLHTVSSPYNWNVSFYPKGNYIVRLECYRTNLALHYSYDQVEVYIYR